METLLTTENLGEAVNTARKLYGMSVEAGETQAASMIYITETATGSIPELGEDGIIYTYQIVASDREPRRSVIFKNGEMV